MSTTATDILDIHTALLPLDLEVERQCHRAAVRLTTLPNTHPIAPHVACAARNTRHTKHLSSLHDLMCTYELKPKVIEKKKVVRFKSSWDPQLTLKVAETKEEAVVMVKQDDAEVQCFSDGSGYKGGVGAASVLYRDRIEEEVLRYRLGSDQDHEVYKGECVGLSLAIHTPSAPATRTQTQTFYLAQQHRFYHCHKHPGHRPIPLPTQHLP